MPLLALLVLFIVVPLAELYVIIQVGQEIGALPTVAILLLDSIIGSVLLRSQGRGVWRRFNAAMGEGRVPHREILDGAMVIAGGALLLTPGFLTDVLGLLLLAPPTRAAIRRLAVRAFGRRMVMAAVGGATGARRGGAWSGGGRRGGGGAPGPRPGSGRQPYDVEGTATEHDPPAGRTAQPPRLER